MTIYAKSRIKALKDRNLSIIEFNSRVLDMVDTNIPDMEKMNFIKIVCNNILEFLTVRFARITNKTLRDYYMQEINSLNMWN
jgi:polyphosphate kinase